MVAGVALAAKAFQVDSGGTLTTNLLSYYQLEDATDYYSTNNLTNHNTVTFVAGKVNNNAKFVKASLQWLDVSAPTGFPTGNSAFSIALWFKPATTGNISQIAVYGDQNIGTDFGLGINDTDNKPFISSFGSFQNSGTATALSAGTYYFLVGTYDGAGTSKLYVNGTLQATQSTTNVTFTNNNLTLGRRGNNSSQYVDGQIDEVGTWSKALSTTEITDLYNSGSGQTMVTTAGAVRKCRGRCVSR